jgi:hypothetical protein
MLRKFTQDIGRFRKDNVHNFSMDIWKNIAASARKSRGGLRIKTDNWDWKKELDRFSIEVPDEVRNLMQASRTRLAHREKYGLEPTT